MLFGFIAKHRAAIIARTRAKLARRTTPAPTAIELEHGVPRFLDQLSLRLRANGGPGVDELAASASLHGGELRSAGFTIGQVVQDYGNICQAITELAVELDATITIADFRTLNICLDIAIADAVTEYTRQSERALVGRNMEALGFLAHELRNLLNTATLAFDAVRSGSVAVDGTTASLVDKSLAGMRDLVTRSLAEARLEAGPPRMEHIPVASLLEEIEIAVAMLAKARDVRLTLASAPVGVAIDGDLQILTSIVINLVQNACKFTRPRGHVMVATRVTDDRVFLEIADECGGLPEGKVEELFQSYEQRHLDRSGSGLGLAISLRGARAIGGDITVTNRPGVGCVFVVECRRTRSSSPDVGAVHA